VDAAGKCPLPDGIDLADGNRPERRAGRSYRRLRALVADEVIDDSDGGFVRLRGEVTVQV
jgi:hypothetical protein